MNDRLFLDDMEMTSRALDIAIKLDGVPMSQVESLLKKARDIALASGVVQVDGDRFSAIRREFDPASH
jgi:hypothetical protein